MSSNLSNIHLGKRLLVTYVDLASMYLAFVLAMVFLGLDATFITVLALSMISAQVLLADKMVLKAMRAKTATNQVYPELHAIAMELASRAKIPPPKLMITDDSIPNAFAVGMSLRRSTVVLTSGLIGLLDMKELEAVLAHELVHIKSREVLAITLSSSLCNGLDGNKLHWRRRRY
jgi:heat shock protein HtpX